MINPVNKYSKFSQIMKIYIISPSILFFMKNLLNNVIYMVFFDHEWLKWGNNDLSLNYKTAQNLFSTKVLL